MSAPTCVDHHVDVVLIISDYGVIDDATILVSHQGELALRCLRMFAARDCTKRLLLVHILRDMISQPNVCFQF